VSLFVEPSVASVKLSRECGAHAVELHTGKYCLATQAPGSRAQARAKSELERIRKAAEAARKAGLHPNAGHGFDYENVRPVVELVDGQGNPLIEEYNIGHVIVCRAALVGMERAVREMVSAIAAP
jgi:pyridoxine 5-phosphate synthase